MAHPNKHTATCHGVGNDGTPCTNVGNFARGYCEHCYNVMRTHCIRNGLWPAERGAEIVKPEPPKWEWPGREDKLAAQCGQPQECEKVEESKQ